MYFTSLYNSDSTRMWNCIAVKCSFIYRKYLAGACGRFPPVYRDTGQLSLFNLLVVRTWTNSPSNSGYILAVRPRISSSSALLFKCVPLQTDHIVNEFVIRRSLAYTQFSVLEDLFKASMNLLSIIILPDTKSLQKMMNDSVHTMKHQVLESSLSWPSPTNLLLALKSRQLAKGSLHTTDYLKSLNWNSIC